MQRAIESIRESAEQDKRSVRAAVTRERKEQGARQTEESAAARRRAEDNARHLERCYWRSVVDYERERLCRAICGLQNRVEDAEGRAKMAEREYAKKAKEAERLRSAVEEERSRAQRAERLGHRDLHGDADTSYSTNS